MTLPVLFLSHGAPTIAMQHSPASQFLRSLSVKVPAPQMILVISAHWETTTTTIATGTETIHDFFGFPQPLYRLNYAAPSSLDLAERVKALLEEAGLNSSIDQTRGRDHGAWVPLLLAWPKANIPVVQLSLTMDPDPAKLFEIGRALKPLRDEGVLIIGSGSATHNLRALPTPATAPWATAFMGWLDQVLQASDDEALIKWEQTAPHAKQNHPTPEHFEPILVARGAAAGEKSVQLHASFEFGSLAMHSYAFGNDALPPTI